MPSPVTASATSIKKFASFSEFVATFEEEVVLDLSKAIFEEELLTELGRSEMKRVKLAKQLTHEQAQHRTIDAEAIDHIKENCIFVLYCHRLLIPQHVEIPSQVEISLEVSLACGYSNCQHVVLKRLFGHLSNVSICLAIILCLSKNAIVDELVLPCTNLSYISPMFVAPLMCFAVVTEGQGVLLATLAGVEQKVIAFCCETLKQLQVWSSVANVVVGDFQLAGHDQILLVKSLASAEPKSFSVENCWDSMFITDFKKSEGFEGIHQKSRHVEAVARFLEVRIEAGKFQEKQLQLQMEKKEDLLKSSCQLMEEMIARPILASIEERSLLARNHSKSIMKGNGLHLAKIEHLYHGLQARTWLLVISVRSIAPRISESSLPKNSNYGTCFSLKLMSFILARVSACRGLILDNATLLLTTVQGQIAGSTSTVRSLNAQDKSYKFVVAVPLRNFMAFASFPVVNIMLTAGLTCEDIVHHQATEISCHEHNPSYRKFGSGVEEKHMCLHTEWLGRICIDKNDLIRQFVPTVGENQLFILRPRAENDPLKLPSEIKSVLSMEYCGKEYGDLEVMKSRTCELVTASTCPFGQATICIFKDAALVSLCAEDHELLSCMASLLIAHFGHHIQIITLSLYSLQSFLLHCGCFKIVLYDIVQSISCEDMLEYLFSFIGMLLGELALKGCNHKSNQSEPGQNPIVEEHLRNSELLTDQTCLHLIPFAHH
eukprot:Gb_41040 [translate_table: standard]